MRLYDYPLSGSCYKVRLFLHMLELEYETIPVDFYPGKEHKRAHFLALNPLGQLPVLDDGGFVLRDAQAILTYLAANYDEDGTWLPREPRQLGETFMWLAFAGGEIMNSSAARLGRMFKYDLDVATLQQRARAAFRVLDDHLLEREVLGKSWLATDNPTIADIACFPYVALSGDGGIALDDYTYARKWIDRFKALRGFIEMPGIFPLPDQGSQGA